MIKIITTVGTSIFTNPTQKKVAEQNKRNKAIPNNRKEWLHLFPSTDDFEGYSASEYTTDNFSDCETAIKKYWLSGIIKNNDSWSTWNQKHDLKNTAASAEIKSIVEIIKKGTETEYEIHLLTSDTAISYSAANLVKVFFEGDNDCSKYELLNEKKEAVRVSFETPFTIKGLTIDSGSDFQTTALNELTKYVNENAENNTILNITGGYKALIPFMTIIGQIKGLQLKYIYEDSNDLITVGNLPINFDWFYIYYWTLLIKENSLNYISPIFQYMIDLQKDKILTHDHLECQPQFKSKDISKNDAEKIKKVRNLLPIYQKMVIEEVIHFDKAKNILKPSPIGSLLLQYTEGKQPIGSTRMGALAELFFYKFFAIPPNKRETSNAQHYHLNLCPTYEKTKFNISENDDILLDANGERDAKDIDIHLKNTQANAIVLGECKTSWAFINKSQKWASINKSPKKDYYNQIKARILQQLQINKNTKELKNLEFLFIVLDFKLFTSLQFINEDERYNEFSSVATEFAEIAKDNQIKQQIKEIKSIFNIDITVDVKTLIFTRTLQVNKDDIINWDHLFMHVDSSDYNEIIIL